MGKVTAADGRTWRIERHWMPRWGSESPLTRHRRGFRVVGRAADATGGGFDLASIGDLGGPFAIIGAIVAVVALVVLLVFVVLPLLFLLVDLVVVLLLALLLVAGRVLFRRPWTIEAVDPVGTSAEWKVVGWRASRELKTDLRTRLEVGLPLPAELPTDGAIS
jgi:hypothetical protein